MNIKLKVNTFFTDFKSACDTVDRNILYKAIKELEISTNLLSWIRLNFSQHFRTVTTQTELRQGDSLPIIFFNVALEKAVRNAKINTRKRRFNRQIKKGNDASLHNTRKISQENRKKYKLLQN